MHSSTISMHTTQLCGPRVLARLHELNGQPVDVVTVRMRYSGKLLAVHSRAVWLEFGDDCRVAITEPVVTVAPRSDPGGGMAVHAHPAVQAH